MSWIDVYKFRCIQPNWVDNDRCTWADHDRHNRRQWILGKLNQFLADNFPGSDTILFDLREGKNGEFVSIEELGGRVRSIVHLSGHSDIEMIRDVVNELCRHTVI